MPSKAEKKKQEKIIQDRTFGLKNKNKSKVVQKYVKGVQQTVKHHGKSAAMMEAQEHQKKKQKKRQLEQEALLKSLFKNVNNLKEQQQQYDPKNTVCPHFKQGLCQKGKKCIYSHDLTLDRCEQIDLYVDQRTQLIMNAIGGKDLNDLSEDELNKMITEKQRKVVKGCRSDIVCKFFMESVEKQKYGWNWTCPNGDGCKYKHCFPPGYKLNGNDNEKKEQDQINIEEKIDQERNKLLNENQSNPLVTFEVFLKWKELKKKKKQDQNKKKQDEKKNKNKVNLRTGKELFQYDPTLFVDDEQAAEVYQAQIEQQKEQKQQNMEENEQYQKQQKQQEQQEQEKQQFQNEIMYKIQEQTQTN